ARHELLSACAVAPPGRLPDRWGEGAAELILKARDAALRRVSLWSWLEGCNQEQAWLSLHEAAAQIIEVLPLEELLAHAEGVLVTAIPPVARANGVRNPFGLPLFQLLLKLAMGPLFAIVGVLILQARLINGLQQAQDLRGLLVWATLFGAAQQSVTRVIDQRV